MRTLKKTLALVLVVAMAFSLCAFGANAAFTDTADSDYAEAIDVMSSIGVINGMTSTTFAPDGNLTREQAAKIIAYMMLGPTNAQLISAATASSFTDVAADRWSAGYIEYCANIGIINGVGDKKFDPEGTLTTAAFTKMLLCALGYKADVEGFTGSSWALNVASLAVSAGVYDSTIAISATKVCTREQACQLAFKALQAKTVAYTGGSTITIGGTSIVQGATRSFVANTVDTGYIRPLKTGDVFNNDLYMQFAEAHFAKLYYEKSASDAFARPAHKWYNGGTAAADLVGSYASKALATFTDKSYVTALKNDDYDFDTAVEIYVNGNADAAPADIATLQSRAYNGVGIEFYDTDSDKDVDIVVMVQAYLAKVTAFYATKGTVAGYYVLDVYNPWATNGVATFTVNDNLKSSTDMYDKFAAAGYKLDSFMLTYFKAADVSEASSLLKFADVEKTTGTLSTFSVTDDGFNGTVTVGGTKYTLASGCSEYASDFIVTANGLKGYLGKEVTLYLDVNGMVTGITSTASATAQYAYVLAAGPSSSWESATVYNAKLLYADGTVANVVTDKDYSATETNYVFDLVTYKTESGKVVLTSVAETTGNRYLKVTRGVSAFKVGTSSESNSTYYASDKTLFLVQTGTATAPVYTAYVGYANVPSLSATSGASVAVYAEGTLAKAVFVKNAPEATTAGATFVAGITGGTQSAEFINGSVVTFYVYDAVVDGEITEVKLGSECKTSTLVKSITYNNTVGTLGDDATKVSGDGTTRMTNGLLKIGEAYYTCTADCAVFYVNAGDITASSLAAINDDPNDGIMATTNLTGQVTAVYITVNTAK